MSPLPGQRAVQRPVQAAMAAQRVIGRALTAGSGAVVPPVGVAILNGKYYDLDLSTSPPRLIERGPVHLPDPPAEDTPDTDPDTSGHPVSGQPDVTLGGVVDLRGQRPDTGSPDGPEEAVEGAPVDTADTVSGHAEPGRPDTGSSTQNRGENEKEGTTNE